MSDSAPAAPLSRHFRLQVSAAVFLGSFLLFLVEPMAAKQLLPVYGGSAAVWIVALVFFQTALLLGYLYAHWLARHPRWAVHFVALGLAALAAAGWAAFTFSFGHAAEFPLSSIFLTLGVNVGLPFLLLGSTSPLLQVWLAQAGRSAVPYRLYALSNLASLLALAVYPTLVEPNFTLKAQRILWGGGFLLFVAITATLSARTRALTSAAPPDVAGEDADPASLFNKILWVLLPMGAAMQLSAVTSYLTANIAAIPMLWVLPLAAYLLSLIYVFQFPRRVPVTIVARLLLVMLASLGYLLAKPQITVPIQIGLIFFLIELFLACLFLHVASYALRPRRASESTLFYLLFAAGGALGSFLVGVAAPVLFRFNYDLAFVFLFTTLLALAAYWRAHWGHRVLWAVASVAAVVLLADLHVVYQRETPVAVRNFYGALRVHQSLGYPGAMVRTLNNGTIQHGTQIFTAELRRKPTSYYAEDSGVGLALRFCCDQRPRRIGVVGLGAGTLAAYGRTGDLIRFYEINPAVEPIARNLFTYIRESGAKVEVATGDGRALLAAEPAQNYDVLVVDAFSGDAIPLHLLTIQAMQIYQRQLAPGGILAFHISNQHVDLAPAIAELARAAGLEARRVASVGDDEVGTFSSTWMLVSANTAFFARPEVAASAKLPDSPIRVQLWTDDFSSLMPLLH